MLIGGEDDDSGKVFDNEDTLVVVWLTGSDEQIKKALGGIFCPIVQSPAKKTWQLLSNVYHCLQKVEKVKRKPCGGIFAPALSRDQLL